MSHQQKEREKCKIHKDIPLRQRKDRLGFYCPVCVGRNVERR